MKHKENDLINLLKDIYFAYWFQTEVNTLNPESLKKKIKNMQSFLYSEYDKIENIDDKEKKNIIIELISIDENKLEMAIEIVKDSLYKFISMGNLDEIKEKISYFEMEIKKYLAMIKEKSNINETVLYFDALNKIQTVLAKYSFKDGVSLNEKLNKFVYDFDRIDDLEYRNIIFNKIKSVGYFL